MTDILSRYEERGIQKGIQEGLYIAYLNMVRKGYISAAVAVAELNCSEEEFVKHLAEEKAK